MKRIFFKLDQYIAKNSGLKEQNRKLSDKLEQVKKQNEDLKATVINNSGKDSKKMESERKEAEETCSTETCIYLLFFKY